MAALNKQSLSVLVETYLVLFMYFCSGNDAAVASFSDDRCGADGVCPNDPLLFTCQVNEVFVLRLVLPSGDTASALPGDNEDDINEAISDDGITAVSVDITVDGSSRNYTLTLSIANASLLAGREIRCDDATDSNVAMAGCPLLASPPAPSNLRQVLSSNTPTTATIAWDSAGDGVTYTVTSSSLPSPVTVTEDESYTLTDLEVETDYTVTVTATNECGDKSPPSTITVRIDIAPTAIPATTPAPQITAGGISTPGSPGPDTLTCDEGSESDGLSADAVAGIAVVVTLLVVLPVGVVLGCCGMWCIMRYSGGPTSDGGQQKVQQLQGAIYEEPSPVETAIPLTDNQAYGHVHMHSRNL